MKKLAKSQHSKNEDRDICCYDCMANKGKRWKQWHISSSWVLKSLWMVTATLKLEDSCFLEWKLWPRQCVKKQRHHFANKGLYSQSYSLSSSHVQMWKLDNYEGWAPNNWCFWIGVLEKTLESPLDYKEIKPVNPKGKQPWIFIGRTDAELQYFGHLILRADSLGKTLMLGKIEGRSRRGW